MNAPNRPLQSAVGGGTSDGMEERIAKLETHVEHIREDIGVWRTDVGPLQKDVIDIKVGLATLSERVNHLPSKGYIVTTSLGIVGAIATLIAFQDHIRAWFAH